MKADGAGDGEGGGGVNGEFEGRVMGLVRGTPGGKGGGGSRVSMAGLGREMCESVLCVFLLYLAPAARVRRVWRLRARTAPTAPKKNGGEMGQKRWQTHVEKWESLSVKNLECSP